jgi:hypothetical protein
MGIRHRVTGSADTGSGPSAGTWTQVRNRWIRNEKEIPMFNRHHNRTQQESHPSSTRSRIRARVLGAVIATTVAAGGLGVGMAGTASAATLSDTTTVSHQGTQLKFGDGTFLPRMMCPPDHPYVLDQKYNDGTGFRNGVGTEFTGWKPGFDVVALSGITKPLGEPGKPAGRVFIGYSGVHDYLINSASYWGLGGPTGWTMTLHCTSNLDKAATYHQP